MCQMGLVPLTRIILSIPHTTEQRQLDRRATQGVINLQGNNTSWQGRLSLAADPSNNWFDLNYGGQSFDSGVAILNLQYMLMMWHGIMQQINPSIPTRLTTMGTTGRLVLD